MSWADTVKEFTFSPQFRFPALTRVFIDKCPGGVLISAVMPWPQPNRNYPEPRCEVRKVIPDSVLDRHPKEVVGILEEVNNDIIETLKAVDLLA